MTQVGKETKNTEVGPVDTGYMIGVEIKPEDQQGVQTSISYIVEDKKNNTIHSQIQYVPMSMLTNLKIMGKKRFRLLKSIMEENFKLTFESNGSQVTFDNVVVPENIVKPLDPQVQVPTAQSTLPLEVQQPVLTQQNNQVSIPESNNVVVDYRTKYFEIEEKNKELQIQIDELTKKLEEIRKVIG